MCTGAAFRPLRGEVLFSDLCCRGLAISEPETAKQLPEVVYDCFGGGLKWTRTTDLTIISRVL